MYDLIEFKCVRLKYGTMEPYILKNIRSFQLRRLVSALVKKIYFDYFPIIYCGRETIGEEYGKNIKLKICNFF